MQELKIHWQPTDQKWWNVVAWQVEEERVSLEQQVVHMTMFITEHQFDLFAAPQRVTN